MIKKILQKLFNFLGYKITKFNTVESANKDKITTLLIENEKPTIFDVGANLGQSIDRYKKIYPKSNIHSFEPNKHQIDKIYKKYRNDDTVVLNNVAVWEKPGNLEFYIYATPGHSSFKKLIPDTTWLKTRSKTAAKDLAIPTINSKNYTVEKINSNIITLDDYCTAKNINQIDILKIDVQGYEDKVLEGAKNLLKARKIKLIQLELIFSEIYENPLNIYDVEKFIIPNNYKLFGISNAGSLITHYIWQQDHIYISNDVYNDFKKNKSPFDKN